MLEAEKKLMKPYWKQNGNKIYQGDALEVLRTMPKESIHCVVTSPPYWGLRDYGIEGQLGLEKTPEEYIEKMVEIFREVKRVLRSDGSCWINLGDSYAGSGSPGGDFRDGKGGDEYLRPYNRKGSGLKPKDLCGIPWRVALALQADGWFLRSAMPWVKRSAMPESVNDRPASALEYMFLLTKSQKYYFDMDAIRKKQSDEWIERTKRDVNRPPPRLGGEERKGEILSKQYKASPSGCNFRNTDLFFESLEPPFGAIFADDELVGLDINPKGFPGAHFATFPPRLPEVAILAGTSEKGCCAECGSPWERVVEKNSAIPARHGDWKATGETHRNDIDRKGGFYDATSKTTGWKPTCKCNADKKPCIVCDIFGGAMTSAIVAHKHNRKFIMIELSKPYIDEIGIPRIEKETNQLKLW